MILMTKIQTFEIDRKYKITFITNKIYTTSTIMAFFKVGWRNDPVDHYGMYHLFEHMIGKRTLNFPEKGTLVKEMESKGIIYNAYTFPEYTYYFQRQKNENTEKSFEYLLEQIFNTKINKDDLENEKKVVTTEEKEYEADDNKYLWHLTIKSIFPSSRFDKTLFGKEYLNNITAERFEEMLGSFTNPENFEIVVTSNSLSQIDSILNKYKVFLHQKKVSTGLFPATETVKLKPTQDFHIERIDNQPAVNLVFKNKKMSLKEEITVELISRILTDSFSSRLIREFRDNLGIIYWISQYYYNFSDCSMIYFNTSTEYKNIETLKSKILEITGRLKNDITKEELITAKEIWEYNFLSTESSLEDTILFCYNKFRFNKSTKPEQIIKIARKITLNDCKKVLNKLYNPKYFSVVSIGDSKK
jgi:predicted Zn-dependent peptidase